MPADFSQFAAIMLSLLATYLLHSTCLLAAAGLFFYCRRSAAPRLRSWIWKTAATAGFITAPFALSCSSTVPIVEFSVSEPAAQRQIPPLNAAQDDPADPIFDTAATISEFSAFDAQLELQFAERNESLGNLDFVEEQHPGIVQGQPSAEVASNLAPLTITANSERASPYGREIALMALLLLVLASLLLGIARLCLQRFWVCKLYAGSRPLESGPAAEELALLLRNLRLQRKIRLLSSGRSLEPAAFGILRWHIVLPDRAELELSREELRSLLAHELAHLVRRDTWWLCIGRLLCTAFAYQPLNFLASRQWQRAAEFICDEWAVRRTGNRLALARCLTTVAEWRLETSPLSGGIAATGHRSSLSERIESLINDTGEKQAWTAVRNLALTAIVLAAVISLITVGPTARFALAQINLPEESGVQANIAGTIRDVFVEEPAQQMDDEWLALRAELSALRIDLKRLEALLARDKGLPQQAARTTRLRSGIAAIEHKIELLEQILQAIPSAPGSAGGLTRSDTD